MEIWKDIEGFEGYYQVSNMGNVRSLDTERWNGKCYWIKKGRVLKPRYNKSGYTRVQLNGKDNYIHRLVAMAFIDGYFDGAEVDHINTNKDDNRVCNLRWVNGSENANNPITKNRRHIAYNNLKGKIINNTIIYQYDLNGNYIDKYLSAMEIKRKYGYDNAYISKCTKGIKKSAYGYIWSYNPPILQEVMQDGNNS